MLNVRQFAYLTTSDIVICYGMDMRSGWAGRNFRSIE